MAKQDLQEQAQALGVEGWEDMNVAELEAAIAEKQPEPDDPTDPDAESNHPEVAIDPETEAPIDPQQDPDAGPTETEYREEHPVENPPDAAFTPQEVAFSDQVNRSLGIDRAVALAYGHEIGIGSADHNQAVQRVVSEHADSELGGMDPQEQADVFELDEEQVQLAAGFITPGVNVHQLLSEREAEVRGQTPPEPEPVEEQTAEEQPAAG